MHIARKDTTQVKVYSNVHVPLVARKIYLFIFLFAVPTQTEKVG